MDVYPLESAVSQSESSFNQNGHQMSSAFSELNQSDTMFQYSSSCLFPLRNDKYGSNCGGGGGGQGGGGAYAGSVPLVGGASSAAYASSDEGIASPPDEMTLSPPIAAGGGCFDHHQYGCVGDNAGPTFGGPTPTVGGGVTAHIHCSNIFCHKCDLPNDTALIT